MKIIASYNIKGGVGKTATAVNLSYLAAEEGARVLIWDLDPQGAASYYFRIKPKVKKGARGLIQKKRPMEDAIKGTDFENLDLIPADFSYRHMDLYLMAEKNPLLRINKLIKPLRGEYDYIVLDCPPSISLVSENIFTTADMLLVPLIPTTLSIRTLDQLLDFFRKNRDFNVRSVLPFFSMVDRRKALHRIIVDRPPVDDVSFLNAAIPYASEIEQMGVHRTPLFDYAGSSKAASAYQLLWDEIKQKLK